MEQRLIDLEIKIMYLERTVETLNEVVIELRAELDKARKRQQALESMLLSNDPPE